MPTGLKFSFWRERRGGSRLVTETQTVEYTYGKLREQSALVAAPLSLEEADAPLGWSGRCGGLTCNENPKTSPAT